MQQRKFTKWSFVAIFIFCGLVFLNVAMADIVPPTSCNTFNSINNGGPVLNSSNPIISIDNNGQWPIIIDNKSADIDNVCNNSIESNYPCTVFKYKINNFSSVSYQHTIITIPTCLDNSLEIAKGETYPACNPIISEGNPDWSSYACGLRNIRLGKTQYFSIPVKGKDVRKGVISMTLVANSTTPNTNYFCFNPGSNTGILGPSCGVPLPPDPEPITCDPSFSSAKTTNVCLPNVAGKVLKVDVVNKAIEAIYECSQGDTSCTGVPTPCIQVATYEANVDIYNCAKCVSGICGVDGCGRIGKICDPSNGFTNCEVVTDAGGTVEEAVGYFVVSERDSSGVDHPTICLVGTGNAICYSR